MMYKILVYENPFDIDPILTKDTSDVLEAEAAVRNLTEKALEIINLK